RARDPEGDRFGGLALRVAGACDELPEAPVLDHHGPPAGEAILVRRLVLGASAPVEVARVPAVGIGGARQELPEPPALLQELAPALRAQLAGGLTDLVDPYLDLGQGFVTLEGLVGLISLVDHL